MNKENHSLSSLLSSNFRYKFQHALELYVQIPTKLFNKKDTPARLSFGYKKQRRPQISPLSYRHRSYYKNSLNELVTHVN